MIEPNLMTPPVVDPPSAAHKDRSRALVVFGIFTILLGACAGLMTPLMLLGHFMNTRNPSAPATSLAMLLPGLLMYAGLAVALIWLGIGSMRARRWSRALLLIMAWSWLVMGVIIEAVTAVLMPKLLASVSSNMPPGQQAMPAGAALPITIITCLVIGFLFILIPAVWVAFYGSRHVKATCEARNPVPGWTDACPLPVLAMSLWLGCAVPLLALMPVTYHGVAPFFGAFIKGAAGGLFYWVLAALWAWAAWRLYRLEVRAWWVLLVTLALFAVSSLLTYTQHDVTEMYRLMGYPEAQIAQIQATGLTAGNRMAWLTGCSMLPFLGYLLFVKKFLRPKT
jgi:hypothetical protein